MKSIKQFKEHFFEDSDYCKALKDVSKLIDEYIKSEEIYDDKRSEHIIMRLKEIKKRIEE